MVQLKFTDGFCLAFGWCRLSAGGCRQRHNAIAATSTQCAAPQHCCVARARTSGRPRAAPRARTATGCASGRRSMLTTRETCYGRHRTARGRRTSVAWTSTSVLRNWAKVDAPEARALLSQALTYPLTRAGGARHNVESRFRSVDCHRRRAGRGGAVDCCVGIVRLASSTTPSTRGVD